MTYFDEIDTQDLNVEEEFYKDIDIFETKKPESLYKFYLETLGEIPEFLNKYLQVPSLIRLKNISYLCGMDYASKDIYDFKEEITRFDHSLTTAMLTWKLTKNKKATIAALFHDIATPCFSHVIDYMNKDYDTQESTEEYTDMVLWSDSILKGYLEEDNISFEEISNFKQYSIVDNSRPKLCADRLDGIIISSISWTKLINKELIKEIIDSLIIATNEDNEEEISFNNQEIAEKVLVLSDEIDKICHSNEDNYMMELLASITREAISCGIINYDELFCTNELVLFKRLEMTDNIYIKNKLNEFYYIKKEEIPKTELPLVKKRELNPLVINERLKK